MFARSSATNIVLYVMSLLVRFSELVQRPPDDADAVALTSEERRAWLWEQLTSSKNLGIAFWITQAVGLVGLACGVYLTSKFWDRYVDKRAGRWIDRYLDAADYVSRPLIRVIKLAAALVHRLALRWLPPQYLDSEAGQWLLFGHAVAMLVLLLLVLQFVSVASDAASALGVHRSEVPMIASGAARVRWRCAWLRIQDGALPHRLASLPLEADAWPWPFSSYRTTRRVDFYSSWQGSSPRWGWAASAARHESPAQAAAATSSTPLPPSWCAGGGCEEEVWPLGRALLWGDRRGASAGGLAPDQAAAAALDQLLSDARALRIRLVGLPLLLLCAAVAWWLWGAPGALLTATLYVLCPSLRGHSAMLTADCVAAFLVHCVLWAAWAWLHATSIAQVLTLATVTALLVGLLLSSGPLAVVLTLATAVLIGFRMLALFARVAATAATSLRGRSPTPHTTSQGAKAPQSKRSFSTRRTRVLNCGVCAFAALAFPTIAGFAAATVHSVPLWPTDAMTLAAETAAWKAAAVRLSPPSVCALTRKRRRSRGARASKSSNGDAALAGNGTLAPRACFKERGVISAALVAVAQMAADTGLFPRLLLTLTMHHAAALAELSQAGHSEWGEPPDGSSALGTGGSSIVYRSGFFAARSEAKGLSTRPPFANHAAVVALMKTPPVLWYLLLLLALVTARTPIAVTVHTLGVPIALAFFARALRCDRFASWVRQRLAALRAQVEWQQKVDVAFAKLMDRHRPPRQLPRGDAETSVGEGDAEPVVQGEPADVGREGDGTTCAADKGSTDCGASTPKPTEFETWRRQKERARAAKAQAALDPDDDEESLPRWMTAARVHVYRAAPLWALLASCGWLLTRGAAHLAASHRLLLTVYPAVYVLLGALGKLVVETPARHEVTQVLLPALIMLLVIFQALEVSVAHPDYGSYFAPAAGGRSGGHFHLLADASDQGQHLPALRAWLITAAQEDEPAYLSYCGEDSPAARGIHARRLPARSHESCVASNEPFDFTPPNPRKPTNGAASSSGGYERLLSGGLDGEQAEAPADADGPSSIEGTPTAPGEEAAKVAATAAEARASAVVASTIPRRAGDSLALLQSESQAVLLPGLYVVEANSLHGLSSMVIGPWTDVAEEYYQVLRRLHLHTRVAASPLRFARLCAMLRKLKPMKSMGSSLLAYRLSWDELDLATEDAPAELIPAIELTPVVRRRQMRALQGILRASGVDLDGREMPADKLRLLPGENQKAE